MFHLFNLVIYIFLSNDHNSSCFIVNNDKTVEIVETKKKLLDEIQKIKQMNVKELEYKGVNLIVRKNDLTKEKVWAIVNPANEDLNHEGGAARAIAEAGGDVRMLS